jgi:hypothetical protein
MQTASLFRKKVAKAELYRLFPLHYTSPKCMYPKSTHIIIHNNNNKGGEYSS